MAGHNLQVTIKSGTAIDGVSVSDTGVDLLLPGTPAQTAEQARELFVRALNALVSTKQAEVIERWKSENITVQT